MDTGFYYCHEEDADVEDLSKISNIYLFVEGENVFKEISKTVHTKTIKMKKIQIPQLDTECIDFKLQMTRI